MTGTNPLGNSGNGVEIYDRASGAVIGGLGPGEVAEVMQTSRSTVDRDWRFARTWLAANLRPADRDR